MTKIWEPSFIYNLDPNSKNYPIALIILNQPIPEYQSRLFENLWSKADVILCADGGANRLYDYLKASNRQTELLPNYVIGDLDSIRDDVVEFYQSQGVNPIKIDDQYSTDFTKCFKHIEELNQHDIYNIVMLGGLNGRFDHSISQVNNLYDLKDHRYPLYIISDSSLTFLLDKGEHELNFNPNYEGPTCGLLPLGFPVKSLTTEGLVWNLENHESKMGGMVSTSNLLQENKVKVITSDPICWTIELK
ncbi:Thiamin pyrophosphokinase [Conidiobolus coronatus NRRL 28638]|uniref:Thiamine pyrophosphokinase n=1 Tax=Conidiobolus coronatus (strain ATCC 28846 / CBS 209.66 / NRRL 28638) TaxID=796925 RepID=A0A137PFL4_CONC2|nr:Thiamin pyrophosphokinase [Conidiobolus coronatus NRRL 28638]|eukprot:KXN73796.1 Thiamin pyrophosphokinase [Conidiobolus coronatus NRRL 28638]